MTGSSQTCPLSRAATAICRASAVWWKGRRQKKWWRDQIPKNMKEPCRFAMWERYKNDYKCALACHALYWSLIVCLPLVTVGGGAYVINALIQGAVHYYVDDKKANKKTLNLIEDQIVHAIQIISIWGAWMIAR